MKITTLKFGGTSMGNAQAIKESTQIIINTTGQKVVVVSATSGSTDTLIQLGKLALKKENWQETLKNFIEKHQQIINELGIIIDLQAHYHNIEDLLKGIELIGELSLSANDRLISAGERLSSNIIAALLNKQGHKSQMLDAFDFIYTNNNFGNAEVHFERTNEAIQNKVTPLLEQGIIPIITGFTGQSEDGRYATLGRGGSDYSAAIVGSALNSKEIQIWTDVEGIFNADPRLIPEARPLEKISFSEAGELAYFGAKVLHPKTIKPAIEKNIPVRILNTFNPEAKGTLIVNEEVETLKSVTAKKGNTIINVCSAGMLEVPGFMAKIFEVFAQHQIVVDVVATSEVSVSITIDSEISENAMSDLQKFSTVNILKNMAIVCLVGSKICGNPQTLTKLFNAISEHEIAMISFGASKRNISLLVKEMEANDMIKKIFQTFFK